MTIHIEVYMDQGTINYDVNPVIENPIIDETPPPNHEAAPSELYSEVSLEQMNSDTLRQFDLGVTDGSFNDRRYYYLVKIDNELIIAISDELMQIRNPGSEVLWMHYRSSKIEVEGI